ncbi:MAG: DUF4845 domain-containing protein [Roseateles sp.]|jgi:hypothetical protein
MRQQLMKRRHARGLSLLGLLFWAVVLATGGVVVAKVVPTVMEYYTIQNAINRIAKNNPPTVPAAKAEFERIKQIEYSIQSISGNDLEVSKDNDKVRISFAYDRQIELFGPVSLLIKYQGHSN